MLPKPPQYGSPLLAILRGGKQTQLPQQQVQFGVPTAAPTFPTALPQQTANTTRQTVQPAPLVQPPQMTPRPTPAINPLDIIRRGKERVISQPAPQGLTSRVAQDFGGTLKTIAGGDLSLLGSPVGAGKAVGKFAFNIPNYIMAGFVGTGRTIMEETLPRIIPGITRESLREDFDKSKGIDEWLLKGEVNSWQEVKKQMQDAIDKSPNALEWEKKYLPLSLAVAGFAVDASGFGKPATKGLTNKVLADLAGQTDAKTISGALLKAGTPQDVVDIATPLVARATTPEQVQNALVRASESVLDKIPTRTDVADDMVLENMARLKADPLRVPPDDFTRFDDLGKQMERRPLTPDEMAEAKAIVERVDGKLPSPEVGAMDIKKLAPIKATEPKTPTVPKRDYPGLKSQGGFADFFTPIKAKETAPVKAPEPKDLSKLNAMEMSSPTAKQIDRGVDGNNNPLKRIITGEDVEFALSSKSKRVFDNETKTLTVYRVVPDGSVIGKGDLVFDTKEAAEAFMAKYGKKRNQTKILTKQVKLNELAKFYDDAGELARGELIYAPKTPVNPKRDYPGLRKQGGFADFFAPIKAKETAPTVKPKTEQRIKIDADIKDIRKSLQNKDLTANQIGELETRLSLMEDAIPDVSLIRRIAGKQLANGDTLSQVQATAMKIVAQSDFLKGISKTDAATILQNPKAYSTRQVEGARIVRRANLDDRVTELGYADLDEAGDAVAQFDRIREEMAALKPTLKEAKDARALSNKVTKLVTTATTKRREEVKFLKDQFGLVDSDVRKATGGRDFRTMSEGRFNDTVREMEQIGIVRADTMQAKAELMDLMERRNFQKVENYRKVQGFGKLHEMNADQFRQYAEALEQFQTDDVFLTQRQLEVVDRSSLAGVRTIREAKERLLEHIQKMPGLENTKFEDLDGSSISNFIDYVRYDTALAEKNPFFKYLVTRTHEHMLVGEAEFLTIQNKVLDLAKKAKQSRSDGAGSFVKKLFVPEHDGIIKYLEAPVEQKATFAKKLTKEELNYANYVSDYYSKVYDYLITHNELYGSRYADNYFTHMRRTFTEAWANDGLIKGIKEVWQAQKESQITAGIISDTGEILPKSKFFQFALQRTGEITPSKNLTKVFLSYSKTFERKKMFDRMIPELDIYVQSLTPTKLTKGGLVIDSNLKQFVDAYLNNKKGRTANVSKLITQNNPIDIGLRMGNTVVSIMDLGFSLIAQTAALVGEGVATYQSLGKLGILKASKRRLWDTGLKRMTDPNASKILRDNEQFLGRNIWTTLGEVDTPIQDKFISLMFGGFSQSTVEANKTFLLASLTKAELKSGVISPQRLAQLKLDAGRWRDMGKDVKSILGSTSTGAVVTKYKGWAIPIMRTNIKNLTELGKMLKKGDVKKALTSREIQETYRLIEISTIALVTGSYVLAQNEEDTFVGKLKARAYMEANTLLSGIDPRTFVSVPRLYTFTEQLVKNLVTLVLLEEYESDSQWGKEGDLKGAKGLQRQFTPSAIRTLQKPAGATGDKDLDAVMKEEATSRKETTDKVESVFKEVENMPTEQLRERLAQEEPDVINRVVEKLLKARAKEQNPEQFKKDSQIKKLTNESKAEYVITQLDKLPVEERREYLKGLLERGVISVNVVNRIAELADERDIIEQ